MFPKLRESDATESSYEPYDHRIVPAPLTNFEAFLSFIKILTGLGIMVSAEAVSHGGYVLALFVIPTVGVFLAYLLQVQFRARYYLSKKLKVPFISYPEGLKLCLEEGPKALIIIKNVSSAVVDFISVINQLGSSSVCLMYVSSTLEENFMIPARNCILFLIPVLMIFVFINDLKGLVPFNFIAMILQTGGIVVIFFYIFSDLPPLSSRTMVQKPFCWALFIARILGATEAVAVVVAIEKNMKTPKAFLKRFGVLNMSMILIVTGYYICGIMGYIKYGPVCCVNYLTCQPLTSLIPVEKTPAYIAKVLYLTGVALTYGITCFPAHNILWAKYFEKNRGNRKIFKYLFRAFIISSTVVLALIAPNASLPVSLVVNTFCLSFLGIIFPTVLHICLLWPDKYGPFQIIYWWDLALFSVGICFIVVSLYQIFWVSVQLTKGKFDIDLDCGHPLHIFL